MEEQNMIMSKDEVIVGRASILEQLALGSVRKCDFLVEILEKYDRKVSEYGAETFAPVVKILKHE